MTKKPRALSSRIDRELAADLDVINRTGLSNSAIVKRGASLLAEILWRAWEEGVVPVGEIPELADVIVRRPGTDNT